ncbi:uncharacterized protein LOC127854995 [Dreissena polymorpha]|uniref:Uncharacterized protein n=1 Tax=Dreissena polymorpha TaxID=45954 RepID=A0A9D4C980_DREPO|nr:uncharacterized protein LOC127854995 [Dreissena polymorpha]XP_052246181.1 uncharacterized protein LOC127854995 [Dreissena polymorpha]XP_052246182.1 uncharacterized protein LOC127854995 [Dreissena polymorpha]XP_052246183.1 uncharacterized protein LOC127854995 [Dreissena polymorpha]KAH3719340.1 hypothetical protein DPMN_062172 [Dreissena polymorpha]
MEKVINTYHHDNNLSHSNSVANGNSLADAVFEAAIELDDADNGGESEFSLPLSNEMSDISSHNKMTFNEIRPRSFSDASVGKERPGILKKLQGRLVGREKRTCMKVFVKRESKVATAQELVQFEALQDAEFGFRQSLDGGKAPIRFPKSASFDDMLKYPHDEQVPPPKPHLPAEYRKSLMNQLEHFKDHYFHIEDDSQMEEEAGFQTASIKASKQLARVDSKKQAELDTKKLAGTDSDKRLDDKLSTVKDLEHEPGRRYRRKISSPEVPGRTSSLVYRHFDTKFQSELLKKELEKLRNHKLVRKNSESMIQKFETILRERTVSDTHVRFADEAVYAEVECEQGVVSPSKPPLRPTLSLDSHASVINILKPTGLSLGTSDQDSHEHDTRNPYSETAVSGTDSYVDGDRSRNILRSQEQSRSKSASTTERYKNSGTTVHLNSLGSTNGSNLSKSASNLRRNMETIRKFNAESLQQKREHVKHKYKQNPRVSISPEDVDVDLDRGFVEAQERLVQKSSKYGSDNRSDEEKYAALSRNKICIHKIRAC